MHLCVLPYAGASYSPFRPEAEIYIGLANKGIRITMLIDTRLEYVEMFREAGISLIPFKTSKKIDLGAIRLIHRTIKENDIDIVYATYSRFISNAAFACIGTRAKMVAYRGTTGGLYAYDPSRYLGVLHPRINGIICVSNSVREHVVKHASTRVKPYVQAIYKGHDLSWYRKKPANLEQFGSSPENFNIACVASERPHKGLVYFLEAAQQLAEHADIHLILIGHPLENSIHTDAIARSGMSERVHITGYREDAPQIMASCDVLVFPSYRKEGLPRTLLESLASKTPVVSAKIPSCEEVVSEGKNGYLVAPRNAQAIAEKIVHLYQNRDILKRLSSNSTSIFTDVMSHQATIDSYERYFQDLYQSS